MCDGSNFPITPSSYILSAKGVVFKLIAVLINIDQFCMLLYIYIVVDSGCIYVYLFVIGPS